MHNKNNIKKLLISVLASLTLVGAAFAGDSKATFTSGSFLNNYQWLVIPTNATVNFNDTNVTVLNLTSFTNVLTLNTNINGNVVPQWEQDGGVSCDAWANPSTNWAISIELNSTNLLLNSKPGGTYPIAPLYWYNTNGAFIYGNVTNVFTNSFGIVSTNISSYYPLPPATPNANSTNIITLTFAKEVLPGVFGTTGGSDVFTWVVQGLGTTPVILSTNLPASFMVGAQRLRLTKIVGGLAIGVTTTPSTLINDIRLFGWVP